MWYDNWSGKGSLINIVTYRDLYNARLDKDCYVADMICDNGWKNASEWTDNLSFLSSTEIQRKKRYSVQKRLLTHDRMRRWGNYDMMVCGLCMRDEESHDHLFFNCEYSKAVWTKLQNLMKYSVYDQRWDGIVSSLAEKPCINNIWSVIRRLCLGAAVYLVPDIH
ncbi:reverse transcriptase zinc-binding domain-containing protein [Tanacetum coccineum]